MKKFKYLFIFMVGLLTFPSLVNATETIYFKNYSIGDTINVTLSNDGKVKGKFVVIENSPQGEQKNVESFVKGNEDYEYVTAMYVGNLGTSKFGASENITYEKSAARATMVIKATNASWDTYELLRLLNLSDIARIGSSGNSVTASWAYQNGPLWLGEDASGSDAYTLKADGSFGLVGISTEANIVPVIRVHKGWVEGAMICNCDDCMTEEKFCPANPSISIQSCIDSGTSESVCIMQLCEGKKKEKVCPKDSSISIQSCIDNGTSEEECVKKLCDKVCPNDSKVDIQSCIDNGTSEEDCIKKLCPGTEEVENPTTGAYVTLGLGTILFIFATYLLTKKKNYFSKIK